MANSSSLKFVVEVQADQADRALKALSTSFNETGIAFRAQAQGMGAAARSAGAEVISLSDRVRDFARGQRAEARTASFFVNEIAQIVPVSSAAKSALVQLGGAFVGGGGLGFAIGAVAAAVGYLANEWREKAREAEEAKKKAEEAAEAERKRAEEEQNRLDAERAKRGTDLSKTIEDLGKRIDAEKHGNDSIYLLRRNHERLMDQLHEQWRVAQGEIKEALGIRIDLERELYGLIIKRKEAELKADIQSYTASPDGFYKMGAVPGQRVTVNDLIKPEDQDNLKYIRNAAREQKEYNDELKRTTALYEQWGNQLADIGIALATNQITAQQAIQVIGRMLIQQVASYLVTKAAAALAEHTLERTKNVAIVTEQAGVAGASAAAQVASTPAFMAAPAVGAAIAAAVLGEMLPLAAASRGWDVPGGGPFPALLHKREMVLPEKYADVIRKGGVGGGDTFYVQALDPRSFAKVMGDRNSEFARVERKRLRRRRA